MLNKTKLSLLLAIALGVTATGRADADHERDRAGTWTRLGDVGTHVHDEEDYVSVRPGTRIDALQLRARGGPVAIEGVRIHYTDGRDERVELRRRLRPGEALTIDVPRSRASVKTLVLDYGNRGPYWRARETAHVQVLALVDQRERGWRDRDRHDDGRHDDGRRDRDGWRDRDGRWRTRAQVPNQPPGDAADRVDWRGELRVRVP